MILLKIYLVGFFIAVTIKSVADYTDRNRVFGNGSPIPIVAAILVGLVWPSVLLGMIIVATMNWGSRDA